MLSPHPRVPRFFSLQRHPKLMASGTWLQLWNVAILWWRDMWHVPRKFRESFAVFVVRYITGSIKNALYKRALRAKNNSMVFHPQVSLQIFDIYLTKGIPDDAYRILGLHMASVFFLWKHLHFVGTALFDNPSPAPRSMAIQPTKMSKILPYLDVRYPMIMEVEKSVSPRGLFPLQAGGVMLWFRKYLTSDRVRPLQDTSNFHMLSM